MDILFYGDSNTWGFDPATCGRYPYEQRWTSICAEILGENYHCMPAGMNGRTTIFDDPWKGCRNGIKGLDYELQSHKPLDLCVVMLGANDDYIALCRKHFLEGRLHKDDPIKLQ